MGLLTGLILGGLVLVAVAIAAAWTSRARTLSGRVGSFECGRRRTADPSSGFSAGVGQYGAAQLYWWRSLSLAPRPSRRWARDEIVIVSREPLDTPGRVLVTCRVDDEIFELAMSREAYAGLTAWTEAAPAAVCRVI
ncbi:DUF2550 domain-containing protein [Cellulomonas sp. P22]|uniref:DUF2550 domain-containing protein n=1 Tax=Cellulomonas sp. P22 TaxID=3373189 RepID=UPI00379A0D8D